LAENLAEVRNRMAAAAQRSGRDAADVVLVAVTKYVDAETARWLPELGCMTLGESRPQSLWEKAEALRDTPVEWHMIGHLQRNKARRTLPLVTLVQSVDSVRLMEALEDEARRINRAVSVLLEVNVSGDVEKTGFSREEAAGLPGRLLNWPHLDVCGLMAMSGRLSDTDAARHDFVRLRELRDEMQRDCPEKIVLKQLSMGMSRDYEVAIEEGATMVRIGSALLEGVVG
jgi:pyridoxal phosphate enzyme (YggS family)